MKKVLIVVSIIFLNLSADTIDAKQLFNIEKIKPKEQSVVLEKSFYGVTKIDESKVVDIVSRFDGYITYLNTNKNFMRVKKDEILYKVYSSEISSAISELIIVKELEDSLYKSIEKKLINLNIDVEEQKRLMESQNRSEVFIKSKNSGIVTQKNINNQSYIERGKTLLQISQIDSLWFVASVFQDDLSFLKKGMSAKIKLDGVEKEFDVKLDFIYPIFDEEKKTVDIRFVLDNKDEEVLPSMFGKVKLIKDKRSALTVPSTSIIKKDETYYVFIPKSDGGFTPKKIEAKRLSSTLYEIISGISKDDEIINNSLFLYDADAMTNRLYDEDKDEEW